jgi:hypothetical protein
MSHVNSEPRGSLGWKSPSEALWFFLDADGLDLTYGCVARAREERGEAPLA